MPEEITPAQILEALNDKADRDLMNVATGADVVVEYQMPNANNNYTWYRKYASGWIEQGGRSPNTSDAQVTITFPIPFAEIPNVQLTRSFNTFDNTAAQNQTTGIGALSTTSFKCYDIAWSSSVIGIAWWRAEGIAAIVSE